MFSISHGKVASFTINDRNTSNASPAAFNNSFMGVSPLMSYSEIWEQCGEEPVFLICLLAWSSLFVGGLFSAGWEIGRGVVRSIGRLLTRKKKP